MHVTLADIEAARRVISGVVLRTPMLPAPKLSALTDAEIYVKYENLQVTNSFKDRGALVKLTSLTKTERERGVVAMSAGNHAQAVAYHAARLAIPATIVMPVTTPFVKVASTRSYGADVVLHGETVAEAQARCEQLQVQRGLTLVNLYGQAVPNDPSQQARAVNAVAWLDAMNAMRRVEGIEAAATLVIEGGDFYFQGLFICLATVSLQAKVDPQIRFHDYGFRITAPVLSSTRERAVIPAQTRVGEKYKTSTSSMKAQLCCPTPGKLDIYAWRYRN